ncbi:hypothetical protein [Pontibacter liquoris]|uniref:hypothetical protein n=1 Tax=Pontibacter liquoris TaxID=2905677 RepID=UPI001FA6BD31|nr:hypothetical protein [Pontibacter liquoris]
MKRFVWIWLFIGALVQPCSKTGLYVLFRANQTYIASHLCEKRHVPGATCQGKCYLKKQLAKDSASKQRHPRTLAPTPDLSLPASFLIAIPAPGLTAATCLAGYLNRPAFSPQRSIFHPPPEQA